MNVPIDITNVTLKSSRLILRPWRKTDVEDFYEYAHVDGVGQMAGWIPHRNKEESEAILDEFIAGKNELALECDGKVIGSLGIREYKEQVYPELAELRGCEIGYVLSKDYWGQGLMPEAVQTLIRYLFCVLQLDFIMVAHYVYNVQSKRVIEKCGFTYIKTLDLKTRYNTVEKGKQYILRRADWNQKSQIQE